MEIYFFGTSSGAPTKERNVSGISLIESQGGAWYLIDCGEGTQHQVLRSSMSLASLKAVFITHLHGDHCYGLPGLLASAGLSGRTDPLVLVGPDRLKDWLELTKTVSELHLPYELQYISLDKIQDYRIGQFNVSHVELSHRIASVGYVFSEAEANVSLDTLKLQDSGIPQGPLWGQIQSGKDVEFQGAIYKSADYIMPEGKKKKIIICGDNDSPDLLEAVGFECDILVHEGTYTKDMEEKAKTVGHSYAGLVANFAERNKIRNLILTHFSARYQASDNGVDGMVALQNEAENEYSGNLFIAKDFDRFRLPKYGNLERLE